MFKVFLNLTVSPLFCKDVFIITSHQSVWMFSEVPENVQASCSGLLPALKPVKLLIHYNFICLPL